MGYYSKPRRKSPLYKVSDPKKVPHEVVTSIEPNREYYVCYGPTDWEGTGEYKDRFYLLAHRWGDGWDKIGLNDNTRIIPEDLELVLEAFQELKKGFNAK